MTVVSTKSAWNREEIEAFLLECVIPIRLAVMTPSGAPLVCSLWYLWADGALWCATQRSARAVECLRGNSLCGFEVAPESPPYKGVRGQGEAAITADGALEILLRLLDRFAIPRESELARWLISREDSEVAIRIRPSWLTAWDFSPRMKGT